MNYSEQMYRIMERELGDVGRFVLEKQCRDINIDPRHIEGENLPRLSRILAGLMARFGDEKARRISMAINNLRAEELEEEKEEEFVCSRCNAPVSSDAKSCGKCGVEFENKKDIPRLFSKGTYGAEKVKSTLTITDISGRLAGRKES